MRSVLDEGVPRSLAKALRAAGIEADPFDAAWGGLKNGELIRTVEAAGYDVLVTNDKNMGFQQNLDGRRVAIVALPLNRRRLLLERVEDIAATIRRALPGRHVLMNLDGTRVSRGPSEDGIETTSLPSVTSFKS